MEHLLYFDQFNKIKEKLYKRKRTNYVIDFSMNFIVQYHHDKKYMLSFTIG